LLAFGVWPDLGGFQGPGGGVIRLDPGLTGAGFNPLASVSVLGPATLPEGSAAFYSGRARYANNYQYDFTNTVWTTTRFSITNGVLSTGIVTSNTPATLVAQYASGGFSYSASINIIILDLPPPILAQAQLFSKTNFSFQIRGVANRKHVVETTEALASPTVWVALSTNTLAPNGLLNFTNAIGTNLSRFYRARESD